MHRTDSTDEISKKVFLGTINPIELNEKSMQMYQALMQNAHAGTVFDKGAHTVSILDKDDNTRKLLKFILESALIVRKDDYGRLVVDVVDSEIHGEGGFGKVCHVSGSVKRRPWAADQQFVYEAGDGRRLVKLSKTKPNEYLLTPEYEFRMLQLCPHMGVRGLFQEMPKGIGMSMPARPGLKLAANPTQYAVSMRKLPGEELFDLIARIDLPNFNDPIHYPELLTIDDRIEIGLAILHAYERDVGINGLVHRDIKLENIMIEKKDGKWHAHFIDLNLARLNHIQDGKCCGNPVFVAPEHQENTLDEKSDLYSLGMILGALFRNKWIIEVICMQGNKPDSEILETKEGFRSEWNTHPEKMFYGIESKLSHEIKDYIRTLFTVMTEKDPELRPTLTKAISDLEEIARVYKLETKQLSSDKDSETGLNIGREVRTLRNSHYKNGISEGSVQALSADIQKKIEGLPDSECSVKEFVTSSNIRIFRGITMKDQLIERVNSVSTDFVRELKRTESHCEQLINMYTAIGSKGILSEAEAARVRLLSEKVHYAAMIADKLKNTKLTIDGVSDQVAKLRSRNEKIERALKGFYDLCVSAQEQQQRLSSPK